MKSYSEKIVQAFEIITSKKNVKIVGSKYKFCAYQFVSDVDGKNYISYTYKSYPQENYCTTGCCEADFVIFKKIMDELFRDKEITVTIKE